MLTAGETSFKAFQKMERLKEDLTDRTIDAVKRGQGGEDITDEFMDLVNRKNLANAGITAIMKLNQKSLQRVLDESR